MSGREPLSILYVATRRLVIERRCICSKAIFRRPAPEGGGGVELSLYGNVADIRGLSREKIKALVFYLGISAARMISLT